MKPLPHQLTALSFVLLACVASVAADPAPKRSSTAYSISSETIGAGGVNAQSATYILRGSAIGECGAGNQIPMTSAAYVVRPGYVGQLSDVLVRATSRLSHNGAGVFDVNLPLSGTAGVEPRSSSTYQVIFTFASPLLTVQNVSASATGATQPGPSSGAIDPNDAHNYIATLTSLPNGQFITATLGSVNDADGNFVTLLPATMGLLIGDSNGDRVVNSGDAQQTRTRSGQTAGATNFRSDFNLDGTINSGDAFIVRSRSGQFIP